MIALVNVPFGSLFRPSMALGQFKAQLRAAGLPVRAYNVNFEFARLIGVGAYETMARFKGVETQVSEWLFAEAAWRRPFGPEEAEFLRLCGEELQTLPKVADPQAWLLKIRRSVVGPFLEHCYQRITADGVPKVVAFSCLFFQTVAALALGRIFKERHPQIKLVYGGACFHGEMGEELMRGTPFIDAISTGEADDIIVPLFQTLCQGETPTDLHGVLARDAAGTVIAGPPHTPVSAAVLDSMPDPDFDEYYADAAQVGLRDQPGWQERSALTFEASRGCWWGQKKHCTFCGLNGDGMEFRMKSPERVYETIKSLATRYQTTHIIATDNILAMGYWKTLLPRLAESPIYSAGRRVQIFCELKSNLTRSQIEALADAGVASVQPGIESLNSHILELMDKGVTALQNVFMLKCAQEVGVIPFWSLLIRLPGERAEDYAQMEKWLPLLFHLRPPAGGAPRIECHRFSPYYKRKGHWVDDLRPARWYRGIFPEDQFDLAKVAYYFDVTWKDTLGDPAYDKLLQLVINWRTAWSTRAEAPKLHPRTLDDGGLEIEDTRGEVPVVWQLDPVDARLYQAISDIATPRGVLRQVQLDDPCGLSEADVRERLRRFVSQGLALSEDDRFLGLAFAPRVPTESASRRQLQMRRVANQRPTAVQPALLRLPILSSSSSEPMEATKARIP